ncbi:MAG: S6e family ribosomal protein [archaeon]
MVFKINVSHAGKTYKAETETEDIVGTKIGDKIDGALISKDLEGYEIEITGTSDKAGFPGLPDVKGPQLKRVLLSYGRGMHKKPKKEGRKPVATPRGLRLRKTVRGSEISPDTVQINSKVIKEGHKKFHDILPKKEAAAETPAAA